MAKGARPFYALPDLGTGHRGREFRRLLDEAVRLVRRGHIPSVAEVAQSAGVSRATAYRYFRSRSKVMSAVIAEALGPVRRAVPQHGDAKQRLHELLDRTYSRFAEYEPHMPPALQLALADVLDLTRDVAVAAHPGDLAVRNGGGDDAVDRLRALRVAEGAGLAHRGQKIVGADVDHVHAVHLGDLFDVVHSFGRLDHAHHQGGVVQRRHRLAGGHRTVVEHRVCARGGALSDRWKLGTSDRPARFGGGVDVRVDDAHHAVVQQHLHVLVVDALDASERRDAAAERGVRDVRDGLQAEDCVLAVDEDEVVAARLRDACDIARAREAHVHAERHLAGFHHLFQRIREDRRVCHGFLLIGEVYRGSDPSRSGLPATRALPAYNRDTCLISTRSSSGRDSPGSTCSTACASSGCRPASSNLATASAAPGTGIATRARAATSRAWTIRTRSRTSCSRNGSGASGTPPSRRF